MASTGELLDLNYDEHGDVLYASLGPPQAALSFEVAKDIWLDYVPPTRAVVGITVLNFLQHYPLPDKMELLTFAKTVVQELLQTHHSVPVAERSKGQTTSSTSATTTEATIRMSSVELLQHFSSEAAGTYAVPHTQSFGLVSLFETPRYEGKRQPAKDEAA